jgi:small subunit ribosomal protein S8
MTDPITDLLNRIRNAQAVFHPTVEIPFSNLKYEITKILEKERFIEKTEKKGKKARKTIEIVLKYDGKIPAISGLRKISKPGQRIYKSLKDIKPVKGGYGVLIISTSKGLMIDKEARKKRLGGEILCEVW